MILLKRKTRLLATTPWTHCLHIETEYAVHELPSYAVTISLHETKIFEAANEDIAIINALDELDYELQSGAMDVVDFTLNALNYSG